MSLLRKEFGIIDHPNLLVASIQFEIPQRDITVRTGNREGHSGENTPEKPFTLPVSSLDLDMQEVMGAGEDTGGLGIEESNPNLGRFRPLVSHPSLIIHVSQVSRLASWVCMMTRWW